MMISKTSPPRREGTKYHKVFPELSGPVPIVISCLLLKWLERRLFLGVPGTFVVRNSGSGIQS
jgi:hypothetical protein